MKTINNLITLSFYILNLTLTVVAIVMFALLFEQLTGVKL